MEKNCKEQVWDGFRSYQCSRTAVTAAGYCRQHDPTLAKEREAKRGPTKFEREAAARTRLNAVLDRLGSLTEGEAAELVREARGLLWQTWLL